MATQTQTLLVFNKSFTYAGRQVVQGQVLPREYQLHDDKLIKHGYMTEVDIGRTPQAHCDQCGRDFMTEHLYTSHLGTIHAPGAEPIAKTAPTPRTTKIEDEVGSSSGAVVDPVSRALKKA